MGKKKRSITDWWETLAPMGTGRTHRAVELLPRDAAYVTHGQNDAIYEMTRKLGRHDVVLVPHDVFAEWVHRHFRLRAFSTIFFDHEIEEKCGPGELEMLLFWLDRAKPHLTGGYPDDAV